MSPSKQAARPATMPPAMHPTRRLYLEEYHCDRAEATVVAARGSALACDRTCF